MGWERVTMLKAVVCTDLIEKMIVRQKPEGSKGMSHGYMGGNFPDK